MSTIFLAILFGFLVASFGWQSIANLFGPKVAQFIHIKRVNRLREDWLTFTYQDQMDLCSKKTALSSYNYVLLILAMICGMIAGGFGFPFFDFSTSTNLWSWRRIGTLCGSSWIVSGIFYQGVFN